MSSGGCPLGYDRATANGVEEHVAEAARRVEEMLFDAVESEAARNMDDCRMRIAGASKFVRGLWALGLSHELLPCGRGHCSPEAHQSSLAKERAGQVRDGVAKRCDQAGLHDRLSQCPTGDRNVACVERQLGVFVRCAARVIEAASEPEATSGLA